jgi:hypothetical protein
VLSAGELSEEGILPDGLRNSSKPDDFPGASERTPAAAERRRSRLGTRGATLVVTLLLGR